MLFRLDEFWEGQLTRSRKGTRWDQVLLVRVVTRSRNGYFGNRDSSPARTRADVKKLMWMQRLKRVFKIDLKNGCREL